MNNAQVIIDQYLSTGEEKWGYANGLVLLLPHGHEGAGPEHTSGYIGRFLQLCADNNLRVAMPSDPAQYFHLLRRQALVDERKPLVVMTPKASLLSQVAARVRLTDLAQGEFHALLPERHAIDADQVRCVVLTVASSTTISLPRGDKTPPYSG